MSENEAEAYRLNFKCPKCGGNLVRPSEIFDVDDGEILICDGEINGSGCDFFIIEPQLEQENLLQKILRVLLHKPSPKEKYNEKVFDIYSLEFRQLAYLVTGVEWDFSKKGCAVKDCLDGKMYGSWCCPKHHQLIKEHFEPIKGGF
jgi:hypothetical protein